MMRNYLVTYCLLGKGPDWVLTQADWAQSFLSVLIKEWIFIDIINSQSWKKFAQAR